MKPSPVKSTIDFEQDGLQHGFLKLPHSHDESAYGPVMILISMAKNGKGHTALLTGGNHGDEYKARSRCSTWPKQSTPDKSGEG